MDSLKSDSNPLAKVPATVDVATVDPKVDMVLPTSGTPLLATISGGSFSASPKESDQPISTVTTSNAWSKPLHHSTFFCSYGSHADLEGTDSRFVQRNSVALAAANCAPSRRRQPVARAINASRPSPHNSYSSSVTAKVPLVPSASVVAVNTPTGSFTEKVHVSCTPSEIVQVTHVTAVTDEKELPPPTVVSVSPNDETCKQLDVSVSPNDETCKQLDVAEPVDSSTQSVPPTPEAPSGKFVGNVDIVVDNSNSSPPSVPFCS
ncbi:unnamed protein product [Brassica napus]|uniref:(rape) hypothetical protein n=1 Tax=Brassica napus TaxID=3708 RepID=A0A816LH46_BRANA|nr:unnamed protein product [Brassica napus]